MCRCQSCLAVKRHNVIHMSEELQADTPAARAKARLMSLLVFFLYLFKYVGLFFLGIMVGGGIVLKNPPADKKALQQVTELTKEKELLTAQLKKPVQVAPSKELITKDTAILP